MISQFDIRSKIEEILSNDTLSLNDIIFIVSNELYSDGVPQNVDMFNSWRIARLDMDCGYRNTFILSNVELRHKNLKNIDFRYCSFVNCHFHTCNFTRATFCESSFVNCKFIACNFNDADFNGTYIKDTILEFVKADNIVSFMESNIYSTRISIDTDGALIDFTSSKIHSLHLSSPSIRNEHGVGFVNTYGFSPEMELQVPDIGIHIKLLQCVIRSSSIINIKFLSFAARNCAIHDTDIINCYTNDNLDINYISFNNVRISSDFFKAFEKQTSCYVHYIDEHHNIDNCRINSIKTIYDNFNLIGDSKATSEYYLLMKNAERVAIFNKLFLSKGHINDKGKLLWQYLIHFLSRYIIRYGESPFLVLAWVISIIVGSGTISWLCKLSKSIKDSNHWLDNIYLSAITFATVGYGDITPDGSWGQILFGLEGIVGVALMSVFIVVLTKKYIGK